MALLPGCPGDTTNPNVTFDLAIAKTGVVSGQTITYTIVVSNVGNVPTLNPATFTDVLSTAPAGSQFTSAAGAACTGPGAPISCTINSPILAGSSATVTVVLTVPPGLSGTVTNCASLTTSDAVAANNQSCVTHTLTAAPVTGTITIVKDAQPNDSTNFSFTSSVATVPGFTLDDDSDGTLPNQQVMSGLPAGTYAFTELQVNGWTLSAVDCKPALGSTTSTTTGTATVVLAAGAQVLCTFTNTKNPPATGSITIVKDAQPNDSTNFTFTSNLAGFAPFPLDDDSDGTLSNQRTFSGLGAGSYTFTETQVAGWTLSSIVCTPASGTTTSTTTGAATVVLAAGANVTCTFTNTQNPLPPAPGSITIVKDAQPNDSTNFTFTPSIATIPAFPLDDDSDGTLSDQRTFSGLPAGSYTFTETQVPGWTLSSIVCTPASGTTTSTTTGAATIVLAAGANVTCTFTNTQVPPATGSITIVKDAQPNDSTNFSFTSSVATIPGFTLDDDSDGTLSNQQVMSNLPAGSYTFGETQVTGWTLSSIVCTPAAGTTTSTTTGAATIVLAAGANVTCTFTNTQVPPATGTITIVKDAQPNDSTNFSFTSSVATIPGFNLDDDSDGTLSNQQVLSNLPAGSYTFTETQVTGWTLANIVCTPAGGTTTSTTTGAATIVLAAGANVTCTFTNTQNPLPGTLTIVKDAAPNDTADFRFLFFGSTSSCCTPESLDDDAGVPQATNTLSNSHTWTLPAGQYNFFEELKAGWSVASIVCLPAGSGTIDMANRAATVNLAAGANVTCTFTNEPLPTTGTITIVKDAQPNDSTNFSFTSSVATIPGFTLDDDSDGTLSNQQVMSNLPAGSYTFGETAVPGWTLTGIVCSPSAGATVNPASGAVTIALAAGDNVTCTFTNARPAPDLAITKTAAISGLTVTYTITVTNSGGPPTGTIMLSDLLSNFPAGTIYNSASGVGPCTTPTPGTAWDCEVPLSNLGLPLTIEVVLPASGGSITNCATVSVSGETNAADNQACVTSTVPAPTGTITIVKDARPNDATNFSFTSSVATSPGFMLDDDSDGALSNQQVLSNLPAGSYTFTETPVSGWSLTGVVCSPSAGTGTNPMSGELTVVLTAGGNVTCTFTNTKLGTLTVIKDAQPNDPQDFHFGVTGAGLVDFDLDDDPSDGALPNTITFSNLANGVAFTVTETLVAGWTTPSIQCLVAIPGLTSTFTDQANRNFGITIADGADVTCTVTNVKQTGAITIIKDAQPNDPQDFHFTTAGAGVSDFDLDDDADATLANTITFLNLVPGNYSFSEVAVAGWTSGGTGFGGTVNCSHVGPTASTFTPTTSSTSVNLVAGDHVTCTFINTK